MSCYHPLKAFRHTTGISFVEDRRRGDFVGDIELPCGRCIGCRMRKATEWSLRCTHEAQLWPDNCFVTLTYGRDRLPPYGSLEHADFQKFMKRLRKWTGFPVRFYMCGEYGPVNLRPHYHACLFNINFREDRVVTGKSGAGMVFYNSPKLEELWGHGIVSVQDLNKATAGYCARYIMKKILGDGVGVTREELERARYEVVDADGVVHRKKAEYAAMSLKPGIGADWFEKFGRDVYPVDYVISEGTKFQPPRYYDKLLKRSGCLGDRYQDDVEFRRVKRALDNWEDNTDARLAVREVVHQARVSNLHRGDL